MADTMTITLGGRSFDVPPLPLAATMLVYPVCQRLTKAGLVERLKDPEVSLSVSDAEIADLVEVAFQAIHAADESLDAKGFLALPITPPELFAAFFAVRIQCGGWRVRAPEDKDAPGESSVAETPSTLTSTVSLPA